MSSAQAKAASVAQAQRAFSTIAKLLGVPDAGYGTPEEAVKLLQHATNKLNGHTRNRFQVKAEKHAAARVAPNCSATDFLLRRHVWQTSLVVHGTYWI